MIDKKIIFFKPETKNQKSLSIQIRKSQKPKSEEKYVIDLT